MATYNEIIDKMTIYRQSLPSADFISYFLDCVHENNAELLQIFLDTPLVQNFINVRRNSVTALMSASIQGHNEIIKMLLDAGCDKDAMDKYGDTALMFASINGNYETVKLLLEAGCDKDVKNHHGETASSSTTCDEIVKLLRTTELKKQRKWFCF